MFKKHVIVWLLAAGCLFGVALRGADAAKDTLVIGLRDEAASLDPAKAYETTSYALVWQMYDNLVEPNKDDLSKIEPELAESWEISDDGKTWTFHLRPNVQFASGNPLNADAVVFSLRRSLRLKNASSWILSQLGLTEATVTKSDDLTVQLVLDKPYAPGVVLACLTPPIASILDPQEVMAHEENGDMGSAWLETHSAGSGRFILSQCKRDFPTEYALTANSNYWGKPPSVKTVIIKGIQEAETALAMLEKGDIDIAWDLSQPQLKLLADNPAFEVQEALAMSVYYIAMNQSYQPFSKPEVREAIRYALNYNDIIQAIWRGSAVKLQTFIPKGLLGYNPETMYVHDIAKAKELMAIAGNAEGFEVEFKFLDYSPWIELATMVKMNLSDIGIRVQLAPISASQFFSEVWGAKRDFQMHMVLWAFDYPDPDANAKGFAHCSSLGTDAPIQALAWWSSYLIPELSQLTDRAALERNPEKRVELYQQITHTVLQDSPFAILGQPTHQYAARKDVVELIEPVDISWQSFFHIK